MTNRPRRIPRPISRASARMRGTFKSRANKAITRAIEYVQSKAIPMRFGEFKAMSFTLDGLVPSDELAAWDTLYDQYQIKGVKVKWVPKTNMNTVQDASGTAAYLIPEIITAIDLDDDTDPSSVDQLLQNGTVRRQRFTKECHRYLKPRAQQQLYDAPLSGTGYGLLPRNTWIDMKDPKVPHYAIKWVITPGTLDALNEANMYYDFYTVAYIVFKNKI